MPTTAATTTRADPTQPDQTPKRFSHKARSERRKEIADFVKEGASLEEACRKFGTAMYTTKEACRIYGVPYNQEHHVVNHSTFDIIAVLVLEKMSLEQIAKKFNLTRQRISAIRRQCLEAGIPLGIGNLINHKHKKPVQ